MGDMKKREVRRQRPGQTATVGAVNTASGWLADPAAFDARVFADPQQVLADLEVLEPTPLVLARRLFATMVLPGIAAVLPLLEQSRLAGGPLSPGIQALVYTSLPDAPRGQLGPAPIQGTDPLALENLCHYASAQAHAWLKADRIDAALRELHLARTLSLVLGMTNRAQNLAIESSRVLLLSGQPDPAMLQAHLLEPMPLRRRAWTVRTLCESLLALGQYTDALAALGTPGNDCPETAAQRDFLHALLGLPPVSEDLDLSYPYARLARSLRCMPGDDRRTLGLEDVHDPEAGYAALLDAAALVRKPTQARQGAQLLLRYRFRLPDQQYLSATMLMGTIADGLPITPQMLRADPNHPLPTPWRAYRETRQRLVTEVHLLKLLLRTSPDRLALLLFGGGLDGIGARALHDIPLLIGDEIHFRGEIEKVPGRTGRVAVLKALGQEVPILSRAERQRFARTLQSYPLPVVNLGWIIRGCQYLAYSARLHGQHADEAAWEHTARLAASLMSPALTTMMPSGFCTEVAGARYPLAQDPH